MTEANEQPVLEDAAGSERDASEGERRGEWKRAAHDARREPQHRALHKAQERVKDGRSDETDAEQSAGGSEQEKSVTRGLRPGAAQRPGEVECAQFASPKHVDE